MKTITILLAMAMLLTILAGCGEQSSKQTDTPTAATTQATAPATTQTPTETPTEAPTEEPTVAPTEEGEPLTDIDPMGLVGTWKRTYTEVEGDRNENTKASITIAGADSGSLTLSFTDTESPSLSTNGQPLEILAGQLYSDCSNDIWYAQAADGSNTYAVTLLDDNTLLLQLTFDFDGMPMVSTQWFARSE